MGVGEEEKVGVGMTMHVYSLLGCLFILYNSLLHDVYMRPRYHIPKSHMQSPCLRTEMLKLYAMMSPPCELRRSHACWM